MDTEDFTTGSTEAHRIAGNQDYGLLMKILDNDADLVHAKDENGWTPLHEAVRGNSEAIIELLVEKGANVNEPTNYGQTPLYLATQYKGEGHPVVELLKSLGAKMGPEL